MILCDSILTEFDEIFLLLLTILVKLNSTVQFHQTNLGSAIKTFKSSRPEFTAARFFPINRSTIFSILNCIITFLIVMVQFK
jgi:hypothetical protein